MVSLGLVAGLLVLSGEPAQPEPAPERLKVAIVELKANDFEPGVVRNLSELFAVEAGKVPGYTAISHQEILDVIGFEAQKQALGCDEASCFTELGGALGVDLIVTGSLGKVGETFVASFRLIDIKNVVTKNRVGESIAGRVELLPDYFRVAAWRLLGGEVPAALLADYEKTKERLAPKPLPEPEPKVATAPKAQPQLLAAKPVSSTGSTAPVSKPWTWQRVGKTVFGATAAAGLFAGVTYHVVSYMRSEGEDTGADLPTLGGTAADLRGRAYTGYAVGVVGIAGAIVFALLEPDWPSQAPVVAPTPNGVAFFF